MSSAIAVQPTIRYAIVCKMGRYVSASKVLMPTKSAKIRLFRHMILIFSCSEIKKSEKLIRTQGELKVIGREKC